ncbi:ubiquitin-like protein 4A [Pectinophora gossypiella]|uniref:ubiquitin-like protein 4A n=1 Tax=Pectinophora gossypiella TaxID=13191 RepID=UPI00214E32A0|nr:ubiquitin-like protein 4A [Pectinophora gossypiella]
MKLIIKKLQGGECTLEVQPTTFISEIKRQVTTQLGIPVEEQKLLLLGRTLSDEQTVQSYPSIKDGTKLNLVVKKPEGLFEVAVKHFRNQGMTDRESVDAANRMIKGIDDKIKRMSWDDIDRLCYNCLQDEKREAGLVTTEQETECDDTFAM